MSTHATLLAAALGLLLTTEPVVGGERASDVADAQSLITRLSRKAPREAEEAASGLARLAIDGKLGDRKDDAIKALAVALRQCPDSEVRWEAGQALGWIGLDALDPLLETVRNGPPGSRCAAVAGLDRMASVNRDKQASFEPAVKVLSGLVRDKDESLADWAIVALSEMGPAAIPALIKALGNENTIDSTFPLGERAARALALRGEAAVPALAAALRSDEAATRWQATTAVRFIGAPAKKTVPQLLRCVRDKDRRVQEGAVRALGAIGNDAKEAVPELVKLLGEPEGRPHTTTIAGALASIDIGAEQAPALAEALKRSETDREAGALARAVAGAGARAVPQLLPLIGEGHGAARRGALLALQFMGTEAADAVPGLTKAIEKAECRGLAAQALGAIGPKAKDAVPQLIKDLEKDRYSQPCAMWAVMHFSDSATALGKIGEAAIPDLTAGLKRDNDMVKIGCVMALADIGPKAADAAPAVANLLASSKNTVLRYYAIRCLLEMKADPKLFAAKLKTLVDDPHRGLAGAARAALEKIEEKPPDGTQ